MYVVNCGIPLPPSNGSIVSYSGTEVGDSIIYKCHDGFRPSYEMSGTCTMDARWQPAPHEHNCTLITGTNRNIFFCFFYYYLLL